MAYTAALFVASTKALDLNERIRVGWNQNVYVVGVDSCYTMCFVVPALYFGSSDTPEPECVALQPRRDIICSLIQCREILILYLYILCVFIYYYCICMVLDM